ncbi:MAG: class I SAM-dependent methyltransferase [Verrucomicrobia bacterium]|nr:class I SAM-dependent methyltransferase [Verrucomicrobiota bacterium]MBV8277582.1 class I SAM-dependent methyltransferase [Verrucomicrobiota bacterium]
MNNADVSSVSAPPARIISSTFTESGKTVYSPDYYATYADGSARSAAVVVPIVLSLLTVKSVVDVGCGVGTWTAQFEANGVLNVCGIDGDYVDRSQLRIRSEQFLARDLTKSLQLDRTFDLAVCLEVAEHLPESRAKSLVADLTSLAPCLLFSAAIPGQGGAQHVNEQYLPYWIDLFREHKYEAIDSIRPRILGNGLVEWFYQQNLVMFAASDHPLLTKNFPKPQSFIHPYLYQRTRDEVPRLRKLVRSFPRAIYRAIRFRLGKEVGE